MAVSNQTARVPGLSLSPLPRRVLAWLVKGRYLESAKQSCFSNWPRSEWAVVPELNVTLRDASGFLLVVPRPSKCGPEAGQCGILRPTNIGVNAAELTKLLLGYFPMFFRFSSGARVFSFLGTTSGLPSGFLPRPSVCEHTSETNKGPQQNNKQARNAAVALVGGVRRQSYVYT